MQSHKIPSNRKFGKNTSESNKNPERKNWHDLIRQWEHSGLPQKEFCREHSLNYSNFVYQRMQLKKLQQISPPRLLPVEKLSDGLKPLTSTSFIVQWPNGTRLCVPLQADLSTLQALLTYFGG